MTAYIGCIGLLGVAIFIALLFVRRKKVEDGMAGFYRENSLYRIENAPSNISESLPTNDNLYCCQGKINLKNGLNVFFYWWEWNIKSNTFINGVPSASYDYHLAVSFAPNTVSEEFVQKVIRWADKSGNDFSQKVKEIFVLDTQTPYRAEKIANGSLLVCWQVLKRRDVYDAKITWLKHNITLPPDQITTLFDKVHSTNPIDAAEVAIMPIEMQTARIVFYKDEDYKTLRQKFNSGWANLSLEIHNNSNKFDKEGYDEFEDDWHLPATGSGDKSAFTLTDLTMALLAQREFEDTFGGRAMILREGYSVEERETLAYCNNPFRLPLNVFAYREFKRRFTERWTDLSIQLYDTSPHDGGLWQSSKELADDFEMSNLKNAERSYLHDYVYISTWGTSLKNIQVAAAIRNNRLGIYSERNLTNKQLKEFNALESF